MRVWTFIGALLLSSCLFPTVGVVVNPEGAHRNDRPNPRAMTRCASSSEAPDYEQEMQRRRQEGTTCQKGELTPGGRDR